MNKRGSSFHRPQNTRQSADPIVVACEGDTEHHYLTALQKQLSLTAVVILPQPKGSSPINVVRQAAEERTRRRLSRASAWAVYDEDERSLNYHEIANWKEALLTAQREGVNLAISNPCIELWFILLFVNNVPLCALMSLTTLQNSSLQDTKREKHDRFVLCFSTATIWTMPFSTPKLWNCKQKKMMRVRSVILPQHCTT